MAQWGTGVDQVASSGTAVVVTFACERVVSLAGVVIMSRLLAPAEIGGWALAASITTLAAALFDFGPQWGLISRAELGPGPIWAHAMVQLGSALILVALSVACWPFIAATPTAMATFPSVLVALAVIRTVLALGSTSRVLLEKEFRFWHVGMVNTLAASISVLVGVALALRGYGVWAIVVGAGGPSLTGSIIQTGGYLLLRPLDPRQFTVRSADLRWYLNYGKPLWIGTQAVGVATQADNLIVGAVLGPAALGFYDRAYRFVQTAVAIINQTFGRVALSAYVRIHGHDGNEARVAQHISAALLLRIALPLAALQVILANQIVSILLGPGWEQVSTLLVLLAPYLIFRILDENLLSYFLGTGRSWERAVGWVIIAGVSLVTLPPLVLLFGSTGAPVAVAMAMGAGLWWQQQRLVPKHVGLLLSDALRPLLAMGAGAMLASAIALIFDSTNPILLLVVKTLAFVIAYAGALALVELRRLRELASAFRNASRGLAA